MSVENTQPIIQAFALGSRFQNGKSTTDYLAPPPFLRKPVLSLKTWRSEKLPSTVDWGQQVTYELPQSSRILSSCYLKIDLPALASSTYRQNPGLFCISKFHLRSGGNIVYEASVADQWRSCLESFETQQEFQRYGKTFLGYEETLTLDARTVYIPLPLPNSHLMRRSMEQNGIFPTETNRVAIELVFTMSANTEVAAMSNVVCPSIANACSIELHTVEMSQSTAALYRNKVGNYSIVAQRHLVLKDWTAATANQEYELNLMAPTGNIQEFTICAVPTPGAHAHRDIYANSVLPSEVRVVVDGITVYEKKDRQIVIENYTQGYRKDHDECKEVCHVVFGSHGSYSSVCYAGSFNFRQVSQCKLYLKYPVNVDYKVASVALQSIQIQSSGIIKAFLD
mgnify:CR=1 FL=1|jgi:hypothetical protein